MLNQQALIYGSFESVHLILSDFDANLSSQALKQATQPLERTLIGDDDEEEEEDEIVVNHLVADESLQGNDDPLIGEVANPSNATLLASRNAMLQVEQLEEERPDTGMIRLSVYLSCAGITLILQRQNSYSRVGYLRLLPADFCVSESNFPCHRHARTLPDIPANIK